MMLILPQDGERGRSVRLVSNNSCSFAYFEVVSWCQYWEEKVCCLDSVSLEMGGWCVCVVVGLVGMNPS